MGSQSIKPVYPTFQDLDGQPLENGYIYVGTAGLDAVTNQIQVYSDFENTVPISQPIRTKGGYPVVSNSPVNIYVAEEDYSIAVQDKNNSQVTSSTNALNEVDSSFITYLPSFTGAVSRSVEDRLEEVVTIKDFGAVGDGTTDDTGAIDLAVAAARTAGPILIQGPSSYDAQVNWNGRAHKNSDLPQTINNFTWSGAGLNARMTVDNGVLYCCEYNNSKIAMFSLSDARAPRYLGSFSTGTNPRHISVSGKYAFVCCHGAASVEVYDVSGPALATLIGTITTDANPKMCKVVGQHVYVANFSGTVQKFNYTLPTDGILNFTYAEVASASVAIGPLALDVSDLGFVVVCGLSSATIHLLDSEDLSAVDTLVVGGGEHASCVFATGNQILVTDSVDDKLFAVNLTDNTLSLQGSVLTSPNPEQIQVIGSRCYVPSLNSAGSVANLDCFDIMDLETPYLFKSIPLTVEGAGFCAFYSDSENAYLYVNGHFTPFNIDIVEILDGEHITKDTVNCFEGISAINGGFSNLSFGNLSASYVTKTSGYTARKSDTIIRVGLGSTIVLPDPETMREGQFLIIENVSTTADTSITNAFAGWSGTLRPLRTVVLSAQQFASTWQWDFISGPEDDSGWVSISGDLEGTWVDFSGSFVPAYRKVGNSITLRGLVKSGGAALLATLPVAARPSQVLYLTCSANGTPQTMTISTDGTVNVTSYSATFTSLNCTYLVG